MDVELQQETMTVDADSYGLLFFLYYVVAVAAVHAAAVPSWAEDIMTTTAANGSFSY